MVNLWVINTCFYTAYALTMMRLHVWLQRIMADAQHNEAPGDVRKFHTVRILVILLVVAFPFLATKIYTWLEPLSQMKIGIYSFRPVINLSEAAGEYYLALAAFLVPFGASYTFLWRRGKRLKLEGIKKPETPQEKALVAFIELRLVLIAAIMPVVAVWQMLESPFEVVVFAFVPYAFALWHVLRLRSQAVQTKAGSAVPLPEETPLFSEMAALADYYGYPRRFEVRSQVRNEDARLDEAAQSISFAQTIAADLRRVTINRISIPIELLHRVDPECITAWYALRYSNRVGNFQSVPKRWRRFFRFMVGGGLVLVYLGPGCVIMTFSSNAHYVLLGLVAGVIIYIASFATAAVRLQRGVFKKAFLGWSTADPTQKRTPEDFVFALVSLDRHILYRLTPEALASFVEANKNLRQFLDNAPGVSSHEVFKSVRDWLTESTEPGSGDDEKERI